MKWRTMCGGRIISPEAGRWISTSHSCASASRLIPRTRRLSAPCMGQGTATTGLEAGVCRSVARSGDRRTLFPGTADRAVLFSVVGDAEVEVRIVHVRLAALVAFVEMRRVLLLGGFEAGTAFGHDSTVLHA